MALNSVTSDTLGACDRRTAAQIILMGMAFRDDDLTDLFLPPPQKSTLDMRYRQGVVKAWNPQTAENIVHVGGTDLVNLPVLNTSEALLLKPGDVVGVIVVGWTYAILGRLTIPGTPAAASALEAIRTVAAEEPTLEGPSSSGSFVDMGAFGPQITLRVGPSGRLLITLSAQITLSTTAGSSQCAGWMGFELSGANAVAPNTTDSLTFATQNADIFLRVGCSRQLLVDGLNPGDTTIVARYQISGGGLQTLFGNRVVSAVAL